MRLSIILALIGAALTLSTAGAYQTLPSNYRLPRPFSYECGFPELAEAASMWEISPYVEVSGCSANPNVKLDYIPNAVWDSLPSVIVSYHNCHALLGGLIECRESVRTTPGVVPVLAHEVGHQLGLNHSPVPDAIMNAAPCEKPDRNTYINCNGISADDLAGIEYIYAPKTPVVPTATSTPTSTSTPRPTSTVALQPTPTVPPTSTPVALPILTPFVGKSYKLFIPMVGN